MYGLNVTRWEDDHPGWKLSADADGLMARPRRGGQQVRARTLDELAKAVKEVTPDPQ